MNPEPVTLVLAWGNPGRLDDGLGPALADLVAEWELEGVVVDSDYQLQVEHADAVARCDRVILLDADRVGAAPFHAARLEAARTGISFSSHSVSPGGVLALARDLFGAEPEAWLIGIRGYEFDEFGERLSHGARRNLASAAAFLKDALRSGKFEAFQAPEPETTHA